jgi:hypothetical protein
MQATQLQQQVVPRSQALVLGKPHSLEPRLDHLALIHLATHLMHCLKVAGRNLFGIYSAMVPFLFPPTSTTKFFRRQQTPPIPIV